MVAPLQLENASELAEVRGDFYKLLSIIYSQPPTRHFLQMLADLVSLLVEDSEIYSLFTPEVRKSLSNLDNYFNNINDKSTEETEETISVEFTRLFRGVKPGYSPLPPYESLYREGAGHIYGEQTVAVLKEYQRFGLASVKELSGEPPDYLSLELEFMYFLCQQEAEAWQKDAEQEALQYLSYGRKFLEEHLMTWLPHFCSEVKKYDRTGLFSSLAELTESWVRADYEHYLHHYKE